MVSCIERSLWGSIWWFWKATSLAEWCTPFSIYFSSAHENFTCIIYAFEQWFFQHTFYFKGSWPFLWPVMSLAWSLFFLAGKCRETWPQSSSFFISLPKLCSIPGIFSGPWRFSLIPVLRPHTLWRVLFRVVCRPVAGRFPWKFWEGVGSAGLLGDARESYGWFTSQIISVVNIMGHSSRRILAGSSDGSRDLMGAYSWN